MRILVINWQDRKNPLAGGAEVHLHEIFGRIASQGNDVTLLCSSYPGLPKSEVVDNIRVIRIGRRHNFNFFVPSACCHLQRSHDIIIDDMNKIPFFTPLYAKIPILVVLHHFFGPSIYYETSFPFASYVYLGEKLVPLIYRREIFSVVSESTRDELIKMGIPMSNIHIIHNAVSSSLCPNFSKKTKDPSMVLFGRIKKYKRPELALYAMKQVISRLPNAKLIVMGSGDYLPSLIKCSRALKIEKHVEFTGYVSEEKKREILQSAWVGVNTSSKEGWGITVLEANACGTPVIASNSPGLRDSVIDGKTGFLVEHGNVGQLAERIIKVLEDKKLRSILSNSAVGWAKKFDWDISAKKMLNLIEEVLSSRA
ncbi:MAG TPA: glycosyltransferase family 1 protein [bacterium (Candidatus Stahlbacteria)]|nr:glycosyltransferase family 1 protein [Candidatus Stahlbacteria bacterium]